MTDVLSGHERAITAVVPDGCQLKAHGCQLKADGLVVGGSLQLSSDFDVFNARRRFGNWLAVFTQAFDVKFDRLVN